MSHLQRLRENGATESTFNLFTVSFCVTCPGRLCQAIKAWCGNHCSFGLRASGVQTRMSVLEQSQPFLGPSASPPTPRRKPMVESQLMPKLLLGRLCRSCHYQSPKSITTAGTSNIKSCSKCVEYHSTARHIADSDSRLANVGQSSLAWAAHRVLRF